jgi:hypothetical protein
MAKRRKRTNKNDCDCDECKFAKLEEENAALRERLAFLCGQFQSHSLQMGGEHSYRFNNSGWPMTHFRGPSLDIAMVRAIAEVKRSIAESEANDGEA